MKSEVKKQSIKSNPDPKLSQQTVRSYITEGAQAKNKEDMIVKQNPQRIENLLQQQEEELEDLNILAELEVDRRKKIPLMCYRLGHQALPLVFANTTKMHEPKRLLCMQCFKEDDVDKRSLLDIEKLRVDYGQIELREYREGLRKQLNEYIKSLNDEKIQVSSDINQEIEQLRQQFLSVLQETEQAIINQIEHQVGYRIEITTQNMERQINALTTEEIVEKSLYTRDGIQIADMESELNEAFTAKGLVIYDRFNRKCHDQQRVDSMLNAKITIDQGRVDSIKNELFERVRSLMAQVTVPDVQKNESLAISHRFNEAETVNVICNNENWIEQFKSQLVENDWFSQFGIKQIIVDWKNAEQINLKNLNQYAQDLNSVKSNLIFIRINEKIGSSKKTIQIFCFRIWLNPI